MLYLPSSLPLFLVLMFMKAVIGLWPSHAPKYSPAVSLTHTNTLQFLQRIPGGLRVHSNSGTELPHCPGQPHTCSAFQPFPSKALKSGSIESIGA